VARGFPPRAAIARPLTTQLEDSQMKDLRPLVHGYLASAGFRILEERQDCLIADKLVFGQERDTWMVWTVPPDTDPRAWEAKLRASVSSVRPRYPDAKAFVLAPSSDGFSRELRQTLRTDFGIKLLVPVWFFDAPFKVEEAPLAASAINDLRALAASQKRVPQPYSLEEPGERAGDDLFAQLRDELTQPGTAAVRVIVGRAGIGKSFLFRALFDSLYGDFLGAKAQQRARPRPIPLLPEHLKATYSLRTEALIDNFLRTDVAAPVSRETFEWLLVNGFATWLLDGLDELYAGDPGFFEYLFDLVAGTGSRAQITIWCRDSVLTTSDAFAEFRDVCRGSTILRIYRLAQWERPSKRQFAWLSLAGRLPNAGEQERKDVAAFLGEIDRTPALRALSGLPFYCDLLLQQHRAGGLKDFADDAMLLNHMIDEIVEREKKKGLLDLDLLEPRGLTDWLEQIALDYVEGQKYADISRDAAMEYGQLVLRAGLDERTRHHILTSLLQFPLFRAGEKTGLVAFVHDLVAEALAARAYLRTLSRQPRDVAIRLARVDLEDPTILRFMARSLGDAERQALVRELRLGNLPSRAFAVALCLLLMARPERDLLKEARVNLEGQNLVAVRFENRDLSALSFRGSDLSHAVFSGCDLGGAQFEGAFLNRTQFEGQNHMRGAQFGDLVRVQSIWAGKRLLEDPAEIRSWVGEMTGVPQGAGEPCPTALQVEHLFRKYITPLGEPRRDELKRRALLAGTRFSGAAPTEQCLEEAVRRGYLVGPDDRERFRRAGGDRYAEMVAFVRDGATSDGIGRLVAALCRRRGCTHRLRP
jgi:uncharacterized protein YjbI with pentapeptide repeats